MTGFFVYTGPAYGTQHDEIDIEFLGKNTRQIQIASFVDGKLTNRFINLGFDAAQKPHLYGFEWLPHRITWFVDNNPIATLDRSTTEIPQTPARLFANLWAADHSISNWAGEIKLPSQTQAHFGFVSFTPMEHLRDKEKRAQQ